MGNRWKGKISRTILNIFRSYNGIDVPKLLFLEELYEKNFVVPYVSRREQRVLSLHKFCLRHEATSNICSTMGKNILSIHTAQHSFNQFKNDNLELDDLPRSGRALELDLDVLKQLIEEDPRLTTRCLAERLGCVYATMETHLNQSDKSGSMVIGYYVNCHRVSSNLGLTLVWN